MCAKMVSNEMFCSNYKFECQSHSALVLRGLNKLRSKKLLFDVDLVVNGINFSAHKAVLASCSEYFRAMFTGSMKESTQNTICLNGVSPDGIELLLDYAYTSSLTLTLSNVQAVLCASNHLQIPAIVDACATFLGAHLDIDNAVDILNLAETFSLGSLCKNTYRFLAKHLASLACMPNFQDISDVQLEKLLSSDYLVECGEVEVLAALLAWLSANYHKHIDLAPEKCDVLVVRRLLSQVHFSYIELSDLNVILSTPTVSMFLTKFPKLLDILAEFTSKIKEEDSGQGELKKRQEERNLARTLVNPRGFHRVLVNVGGFLAESGITNILTYNSSLSNTNDNELINSSKSKLTDNCSWRCLSHIPHIVQCNFGVAVLNNALYVVGGCFNQFLQEQIHPFGFRYEPRHDRWTNMTPMRRERCRFFLASAGGRLIATGGAGETPEGDLIFRSDCEIYNPESNTWSPYISMPTCRAQHAGAVLSHSPKSRLSNSSCLEYDTIFISGGLEFEGGVILDDIIALSVPCSDTAWALSSLNNNSSWKRLAPMLSPRADHGMVALNQAVYVIGGWCEDENSERIITSSVDMYSIPSDQWSVISQLPTPRYHGSVTLLDHSIYVIGGFTEGSFNHGSKKIEVLDLNQLDSKMNKNNESSAWKECSDYPVEIWEHVSCLLYVPICREDEDLFSYIYAKKSLS